MKKLLIAALLAATSTPVYARDEVVDDGNELLSDCNSSGYYMEGFCLGYIRGLDNGVMVMLTMNNKHTCRPGNVTVGQLRDVILSYIRRNPSKRSDNNVLIALNAYNEAWPCGNT